MPDFVEIFETGPRDGLQNEPRIFSLDQKLAMVRALRAVRFKRIEVASFVSPKWVPQMAGGAELLTALGPGPWSGLVPNLRGYASAARTNLEEIAIFVSASEGFSRANLNCSVDESLSREGEVAQAWARDRREGKGAARLRGYVSCVAECPFDGAVAPDRVAHTVDALFAMGCDEVSLGDTIGRATPVAIDQMLRAVTDQHPAQKLAGHFHDTGGQALDNVGVSLAHGLRVFDSTVLGLGGCPYAPGAAGNLETRKLAEYLTGQGFRTGLDMDALGRAETLVRGMLDAV